MIVRVRDRFCFWCTVEIAWWKALLGYNFCRDCMMRPGTHGFHSRVGMKDK